MHCSTFSAAVKRGRASGGTAPLVVARANQVIDQQDSLAAESLFQGRPPMAIRTGFPSARSTAGEFEILQEGGVVVLPASRAGGDGKCDL